jgi:hypothetical protein
VQVEANAEQMEATTLQSEAPARLKEGVVVHPEGIAL